MNRSWTVPNVLARFTQASDSHPRATSCVLIACMAALYAWIVSSPTLADPDSVYHAKMSALIASQGVVREFPWMAFNLYRVNFVDHHFLYHVLCVPFLWLLHDPLVAIKVSGVFFALVFIGVFYASLARAQVRGALWFALAMALSGPMLFRLSLPKAGPLSLTVLTLGLIAAFEGRKSWLVVLSFAYVSLYTAWPVLPCVVAMYVVLSRQWNKNGLQLALSSLGGALAGAIANPYFPHNFVFWARMVGVNFLPWSKKLRIGMEWTPLPLDELGTALLLPGITVLVALGCLWGRWRRLSRESLTLWILAGAFFVMMLSARRHLEYVIPLLVLASAFTVRDVGLPERWRAFKEDTALGWLATGTLITALGLLAYNARIGIDNAKSWMDRGRPYSYLQEPSQWLRAHTKERAVIFHTDWDDFPSLFYYNDRNVYLSGMEQVFMYLYNADRYQEWREIVDGYRTSELAETITRDFGAHFVLARKSHGNFVKLLQRDPRAHVRYQTPTDIIFELN